jgi:DNA repair exonuclease SbcCD nuclease subunit
MKIGIVGDLHLGMTTTKAPITNAIVKGQHALIDAMLADFEERGITDVVFVGDVFDNRRFVASEVLDYAYRLFSERMASFNCYVIAGNHDLLYDNSSDVCQIRVLDKLPNVHLYIDTVVMEHIGSKKWFFVPWVPADKVDKVNKWLVKASRGNIDDTVIVGHFDMIGVQMEAKTVSTAGFDPKRFLNAAKLTISGHYHCRSEYSDGNSLVCYVGTPYQMSFGHVGVPAGYHVYDDDTGELEFIENTVSPRFVDVRDDAIDEVEMLDNCIVRYYADKNRTYDEAAELKGRVVDKHPIYIDTVPCGEDPVDEDDVDAPKTEEEARQIMTTDSIGMARMYLERHPEILPELSSGEDAKDVAIEYIKEYDSKIK